MVTNELHATINLANKKYTMNWLYYDHNKTKHSQAVCIFRGI